MANPQKENGFTQLSNEIMENIYITKLNGTQFSIVMVVWRYTYGFQRKDHELSETFISKATMINKRQIQREMKKLIDEKIIIVTKEQTNCLSRKIMFNKNHDQWGLKRQVVTKKTGGDELDTSRDDGLDTSRDDGLDTSRGDELDTQERKKENIKENIKESDVLKCFKFYNKNIGPIPPMTAEKINHFLDDGIEDDLIVKSLEMAKGKKAPWSYANGILRNCLRDDIKTLIKFNKQDVDKKKKSTSPDEFKNMMEDFING